MDDVRVQNTITLTRDQCLHPGVLSEVRAVKVSLWRFGKGSAFIVTYLQSHQEDILGGNVTLCFFFFEEIEVKEEDVRRQWEKSECKNVSKCVRVSVRWRLERSLRLFVSRWSSFPPTLLSLFCSLCLQSGWWGWRYYVCSDSASVKELSHCREHFITMRILMHFSRLIPAVILDC